MGSGGQFRVQGKGCENSDQRFRAGFRGFRGLGLRVSGV